MMALNLMTLNPRQLRKKIICIGMKKYLWIMLFIISFIMSSVLYYKYDKEGYHYGLECSFCNDRLPYNLEPHDGSEFSFTLKDEDGFEIGSYSSIIDENVKSVLDGSFYGFDIDITMVRLGLMNLIMHGIDNPKIDYKDSLSKSYNEFLS